VPPVRHFGRINRRGLYTLIRRGVTRQLNFWVETMGGPLISSLLFVAVFALARGIEAPPVFPGVDSASFVAPGIIVFACCRVAFGSSAGYLIFDKMEGVVNDLLSAPLTAGELVFGWIVASLIGGLMVGALVTLALLPFVSWPDFQPLTLFVFASLAALLFALIGILSGLWAKKWDYYAVVESFLILPLALLSGTFFLREDLPGLGQLLLTLNPVYYAIDGFRSGLVGQADSDPLIGIAVLLACSAILWFLAWRLVSRGWRLKT